VAGSNSVGTRTGSGEGAGLEEAARKFRTAAEEMAAWARTAGSGAEEVLASPEKAIIELMKMATAIIVP
jgi:hypothetical protein